MLSYTVSPRALSARLYAEGFDLSPDEARADLAALCHAGAIPLALTRGEETLSQGLGIPIDTDRGQMLYLYALTTDRASRGQGLLRTLLKETAAMAEGAGFASLSLLPASAPLYDSYRRMGFTEELASGGAAAIASPADLAYRTDLKMHPIADADALYAALGKRMSRPMFDYTLATLAPTVLPMRTEEGGYALAPASDPRYVLAASFPVSRIGTHTLLCAPISGLTESLIEPLPR